MQKYTHDTLISLQEFTNTTYQFSAPEILTYIFFKLLNGTPLHLSWENAQVQPENLYKNSYTRTTLVLQYLDKTLYGQ